jgi:23S rRNA pseudouridine1911/1915/1917 synthase
MSIRANTVADEADYVVLDKPAGLLSIPDREGKDISLKQILQKKFGTIYTVHRLDRETSGLILFAKNETAHKFFSTQFESRQTVKIYQGLVNGKLPDKTGTINAPIMEHPARDGRMIVHQKGKEAITDYEVLEAFGIYSFLQFRIYTGRTHQIRVHMKETGHPVVCDKLYGDGKPVLVSALKTRFKLSKNEETERPLLNRLALHASRLSFTAPDGELKSFEAALHKDMRAVLQQLRKASATSA